jgi:predicted CXXCH cytochrome family protein
MQPATDASVLAAFDGRTLRHGPERVRPLRDDDGFAFEVRDGDAPPRLLPVTHAFGIAPLQQYLVDTGRGRLQAFTWVWDARPAHDGQRWYFLYPGDSGARGSRLHWDGPQQNWNHQCADCHVTAFAKGYDAARDAFDTRYAEAGVGCEACHGPGSAHVDWARLTEDARARVAKPVLATAWRAADGGAFAFADGAAIAHRTPAARAPAPDVEACGACHARRTPLVAGPATGEPLDDAYRLATLDPGLYFADGAMDDEVFNLGSFMQSRMHAAGVGCIDCHDPHGGRLRAPGNALCAQCHQPAVFDAPAHRGHADAPTATACTACHMPTRTYMGIDARHDHAFARPDPQEAARVGAPDPCTACHADRPPAALAAAIDGWRRDGARPRRAFADALHAGRTWQVDAGERLRAVVDDPAQAAIVRASAWRLLAPRIDGGDAARLAAAVRDPDPRVRVAIGPALAALPAAGGAQGLSRLAGDPRRSVRLAAAAAIAGAPATMRDAPVLAGGWPPAREAWRASLLLDADRPEALAALAALDAREGALDAARAKLERALALDPTFGVAVVNLAEVRRVQGDAAGALALLRDAAARLPEAAEVQHALGLAEVRAGDRRHALGALEAAARLAPDEPRYAFVHAVALHDIAGADAGIAALAAAQARHPGYAPHVDALLRFAQARGDAVAVARWSAARAAIR